MDKLREDFKRWLIRQGLAEKTTANKPSTIYDYLNAINTVCKMEGHITWEELASNLFNIIDNYHGKFKTALNKYNEFLYVADIPSYIRQKRNEKIICLMDKDIKDLQEEWGLDECYTTQDLADILRRDIRTIKRWRQNRIKQNKLGQVYENTDGTDSIGPKFTQIGSDYLYRKKDLEKYLRIDS